MLARIDELRQELGLGPRAKVATIAARDPVSASDVAPLLYKLATACLQPFDHCPTITYKDLAAVLKRTETS